MAGIDLNPFNDKGAAGAARSLAKKKFSDAAMKAAAAPKPPMDAALPRKPRPLSGNRDFGNAVVRGTAPSKPKPKPRDPRDPRS